MPGTLLSASCSLLLFHPHKSISRIGHRGTEQPISPHLRSQLGFGAKQSDCRLALCGHAGNLAPDQLGRGLRDMATEHSPRLGLLCATLMPSRHLWIMLQGNLKGPLQADHHLTPGAEFGEMYSNKPHFYFSSYSIIFIFLQLYLQNSCFMHPPD